MVRARYRDGLDKPKLLTPGDVVEYRIKLRPTSNEFQPGHRIRLDISSSNFPRFDVNPNTGEPIGLNRRLQVVDNTVHHSAARGSYVLLPIVPVIVTVLAFNFLGDGLRDAADPYK